MSLVAIIFGLILDRTLVQLHDLRDLGWFEYLSHRVLQLTRNRLPPLPFSLIVLPPLLLVSLVLYLFDDFLFGLPGFLSDIAVFVYCLGPGCLTGDIDAYLHARNTADEDEALHIAGMITGHAASASPDQQIADVTRAILFVANDRLFAVIFWFTLAGPVGALFYRLSAQLGKQFEHGELSAFAGYIQAVLAYLPTRLLAVGYALAGNFDAAYHAYRDRLRTPDIASGNYDILTSTGIGAMKDMEIHDETASVRAAQALVLRAVTIWLTVLALLTLGGLL